MGAMVAAIAVFLVFFSPIRALAETIVSGTVTGNQDWVVENSPYIISGEVTINPGWEIRIFPGVVVKFEDENSILIFNNAELEAIGTEDEKIYFTSIKDDTVGGDTNGDSNTTSPTSGDWKGIWLPVSQFPSIWSNVVVRYAGADDHPTVFFDHALNQDITMQNVLVTHNLGTGIKQIQGHLNIESSEISNNGGDGLKTEDASGFSTIIDVHHSVIFGNLSYGANAAQFSSFRAENNYWGNSTGPFNENLNPNGLGDAVTDNILFNPWCMDELCAPPPEECAENCFSNVLFLPGIKGSNLKMEGDEL